MIDEIWTICYDEAKEFVESLNSDSISVQKETDISIGNMSLGRVRLHIDGKDEDELYKKFKLRFMRGGG